MSKCRNLDKKNKQKTDLPMDDFLQEESWPSVLNGYYPDCKSQNMESKTSQVIKTAFLTASK